MNKIYKFIESKAYGPESILEYQTYRRLGQAGSELERENIILDYIHALCEQNKNLKEMYIIHKTYCPNLSFTFNE